jgi:hypothetical protein
MLNPHMNSRGLYHCFEWGVRPQRLACSEGRRALDRKEPPKGLERNN